MHLEIPTRLAEGMNFFAVAIIRRRVAGKPFAVTDHFAGAFFEFEMSAARMIDPLQKAHRPVVSIAIDIHASPRGF